MALEFKKKAEKIKKNLRDLVRSFTNSDKEVCKTVLGEKIQPYSDVSLVRHVFGGVQTEKEKQMYRFVGLGRMSSGLFHDLGNSVQLAILSLFNIKKITEKNGSVELNDYVNDAIAQMDKVKDFIRTAKSQVSGQGKAVDFDPEEQISCVFQMFAFKARAVKVKLVYSMMDDQVHINGNPLSFNRLISGLISNAIDGYDGVPVHKDRTRSVVVSSKKYGNTLIFSISDNGNGISNENKKKIFKTLFTTKNVEKGSGVGLFLCKEIVENEFGGKINFESNEGEGTTFRIELPVNMGSQV